MFGIGGSEFIIIAVVALLLFGPDKLPQFGRTVGRFLRDFKRYQDVMESTIKAEMYASESLTPKDPFKTGKDFREKVQAERAAAKAKAEAETAEAPGADQEETASTEGSPIDAIPDVPDADGGADIVPEPEPEPDAEGEGAGSSRE